MKNIHKKTEHKHQLPLTGDVDFSQNTAGILLGSRLYITWKWSLKLEDTSQQILISNKENEDVIQRPMDDKDLVSHHPDI